MINFWLKIFISLKNGHLTQNNNFTVCTLVIVGIFFDCDRFHSKMVIWIKNCYFTVFTLVIVGIFYKDVFRSWHLLGWKYLFVVNCMWIAFHVLSNFWAFCILEKSGGAEFQKEFTNNNLSRSKVRAVPYPLLSTQIIICSTTIKINNRL